LTVSIQTRNSAPQIRRLIDEAYTYGDEVIVGVDADSHDDTFKKVAGAVDVAYRFRHPGLMAPARLLALEHATGDWVLSLDDDESMEDSFNALRDELMRNEQVTHYFFPRKNLSNLSPCEYVRAHPLFPDWQLRLFRNDPSLVWKPPRVHTGYWVQGMGHFETRTSLLHFEHLWCSPEQRAIKQMAYRRAGSDGDVEKGLAITPDLPVWPAALRLADPPSARIKSPLIHDGIRELTLAPFPDWKAHILEVKMHSVAAAGSPLVAEVLAQNIGSMSWTKNVGSWPYLNLAFRLLNEKGELLQRDGYRFPVQSRTSPGNNVLFLAPFNAPDAKGNYLLEWDMVSENECWFQDLGGQTSRTPLQVE